MSIMTLCQICDKAIQLVWSRNPDTQVDHNFWVHYAPLVAPDVIETHKAIRKRAWSDYDCYGNPTNLAFEERA